MARRVEQLVLDDITGDTGAKPVTFALDGTDYEIDLIPVNRAKLDASLSTFISHARRVGKGTGGVRRLHAPNGNANGNGSTKEQRQQMREWWRANQASLGLPPYVERGRIPGNVETAYSDRDRTVMLPPVPTPTPEPEPVPEPTPEPISRPASPPAKADRPRGWRPENADLQAVLDQAGTVQGVADYYTVSYPTAAGWVKKLRG